MNDTADAGAAQAVPDQVKPVAETGNRITSLDFIRGLAVMGILAANIVAFGQPMSAYLYPDAFLVPAGDDEGWMWIAQFVLIDGKMRGLFTILFGAGLYLFMEKAWARGQTRWLQARRLLWLGLFGLFHYFFIWKGDILFLYAIAGLVALPFLKLARRTQFIVGLLGYFTGAVVYAAFALSMVAAVSGNIPGDAEAAAEAREEMIVAKNDDLEENMVDAQLVIDGDYAGLVAHNFTEHAADLGFMLLMFWLETLPLMLIGMALYRKGMFSGGIDRKKQLMWGWAGLIVGALLHLWIAIGARDGGLTYYGTIAAFVGWSHMPRLFMALGLAALLALWGSSASGWLADRVSAAGRAAFTNYLGTSVLMMLVFHGWALGLFGLLNRPQLYVVVVLAWIVMLLWSKPWLERFRYGPLEWLWRCLTYGRRFALRR